VGVAIATLVGALSMVGAERLGSSGGHAPARKMAAADPVPRPPVRPVVLPAQPRSIDCGRVKCIALTFDDGPMPDTARLLRILRRRGVRATFFLVGQMVDEHPELVRQELADGHELGDHSWNHANLPTLSAAGVRSQLSRTQEAVRRAAGVVPEVFRPPYGSTNARVAGIARQFKLPQILWEVDPLDWRDRNTATVQRRVIRGARRGDIVLMHDIHPTTVSAVPAILDRLSKEGFTFVTVSELFGGTLTPGRKYEKLDPSALPPAPAITAPPQALRAR
jgi:peptidoglycan/xylan/chitin deacetylase (PgdA/CDA1 family)